MQNEQPKLHIRLDKWLWAARFFKTRSLAKQAIEGGHVHYNGARVKVSKVVEIDAQLRIRQGWDYKIVIVAGLSSQRGPATVAGELYRETEASIEARQLAAEGRRAAGGLSPAKRPDKKQRRQIHRFKNDS
jgi:ribosome-associated heat shock protein Hsp15